MKPTLVMAVAVGGAIGAVARYGLSVAAHSRLGSAFPHGTLAANLIGCLMLGFVATWLAEHAHTALHKGLTIGVIGALTTFSTFCLESIDLMRDGNHGLAMANLFGSVLAGLLMVGAGMLLAHTLGH